MKHDQKRVDFEAFAVGYQNETPSFLGGYASLLLITFGVYATCLYIYETSYHHWVDSWVMSGIWVGWLVAAYLILRTAYALYVQMRWRLQEIYDNRYRNGRAAFWWEFGSGIILTIMLLLASCVEYYLHTGFPVTWDGSVFFERSILVGLIILTLMCLSLVVTAPFAIKIEPRVIRALARD